MTRIFSAFVLAALLAACGGGGGNGGQAPGTPVLTGVFVDGPVRGLRYSTPTQSGLTDAAGEFSYQAGETVTFSVGGIVIGSAPGAARVTPFDLFGLAPPASEAALRAALQHQHGVSDFDRVANIAYLLLSLDNDGDPDNGLDLDGWDAALSSATLSFEADLYAFPAKAFVRFANAHEVARRVNITEPLTHLYRTLGLAAPAHALSARAVDTGANGTVDALYRVDYGPAGLATVARNDADADGHDDQEDLYSYDAANRLSTWIERRDDDDDGTVDTINTFDYRYDADGLLVESRERYDDDADDIVDREEVTTSAYDTRGNRLAQVTEDFTAGTLAARRAETYGYDGDGNRLTRVVEGDDDLDGTTDWREASTYTYDADGNLVSELNERDFDADGTIDQFSRRAFTYDARGNRLTRLRETGLADRIVRTRTITISTYDSEDNPSTRTEETDDPADGNIDSREFESYTHDADGNQLTRLRENDEDADGTIDSRAIITRTYDSNGKLLTWFEQRDDDADGRVDRSERFSYTYDAGGAPREERAFADTDGDGIADTRDAVLFGLEALPDALPYLIYEYQ